MTANVQDKSKRGPQKEIVNFLSILSLTVDVIRRHKSSNSFECPRLNFYVRFFLLHHSIPNRLDGESERVGPLGAEESMKQIDYRTNGGIEIEFGLHSALEQTGMFLLISQRNAMLCPESVR